LLIHIGRLRQAQFVVNDPRVSRTHARIDWRNGSVMLVDLSSYGCWVRFAGAGADLLLRREECVLHGRGEIALGSSFADLSAPIVSFSVS
jgi:predicted component of type VI protein secretion system